MANGNILSPDERDKILGSVFAKVPLEEASSPLRINLISGGGSDRSFYRIQKQGTSIILMVSFPGDGDFQNYLEAGRFLRKIGVGVPEIYEADSEKQFVFMEDVGDESLYLKVKKGMREEELIFWYERVLKVLARMQVEGEKRREECPALSNRKFDYEALRWETEYFAKNFVQKYCEILIHDKDGLCQEFDSLAKKVSAEPLYFMHRDFQSQNIMIHQDKIRILDFQGARRGLLQYDLVSVLKDAYVVLPEDVQKNLLSFYLKKIEESGVAVKDREAFYETFALAGLQRNMQALGAFAFLSLVKGKEWFKQYIPAGVNYLYQALKERNDFPILTSIVEDIAFGFLD